MKKISFLILAITILLFFASCAPIDNLIDDKADRKDQIIKSKESNLVLTFPGTWTKEELNTKASIEMTYMEKQQYMIVLEEAAVVVYTIDDYTSVMMNNTLALVDINDAYEMSEMTDITIGKDTAAKQFELSGTADKVKTKYFGVCAEVNDRFYFFLSRSLQSTYDEAKPVFIKILNSANFDGISPPTTSDEETTAE